MTAATFTRLANSDGRLTKHYRLVDGVAERDTGATLSRGRYERVTVNNAAELAECVTSLGANEALAFGITETASGEIVSRRNLQSHPGAIARTRAHFAFAKGPGIVYFDHDAGHVLQSIATAEAFRDLLVRIAPELVDAPMVITASASTFIYNATTGEQLVGPGGWHAYVIIESAADAPRLGRAIYERAWALGLGQYVISKSGRLLDRNVIDAAVWQPERLDFAAGADTQPPLEQRRPAPLIVNGSALPFSSVAIGDPDVATREAANKARAAARAAVATEAAAVRAAYILEAAEGLTKARGTPSERAREVVREAVERNLLFADFVLYPDGAAPVTVGEVLDDPGRWHGRRFADPVEPEYRGDTRIAHVNLRSGGRPSLFSHAHGGQRYELVRQPATLRVQPGEEPRLADECLAIMAKLGDLYEFGGGLARVTGGAVCPVDADYLLDYLGRHIRFERFDGRVKDWRPIRAPREIAAAILARKGERGLPVLDGVITAPTLRPDGSVFDAPGYDPATRLLFISDDVSPERVPTSPSLAQVQAAFAELWSPFASFPFDSDASRPVVLAAAITAVLRRSLSTAPGFGLDAADAGSGKSLAAKTLAALTGGAARIATPPRSEDEQRKSLFADLRGGAAAIIWDNLASHLEGASVCAMLTAANFGDRVLGESNSASYPNRALFIVTGNNLEIRGDASRRFLVARIAPGVEAPYLRRFDFDPEQRATDRRQRLARAALTLVRGYLTHCHQPPAPGRTASFEAWDDLVRQPVAWLATLGLHVGLADPVEGLRDQVGNDPQRALVGRVFDAWRGAFGNRSATVREVFAVRNGITFDDGAESELREALKEIEDSGATGFDARRFGNWLKRHRGRIVNGLTLNSNADPHAKVERWQVRPV